MRIHQGTLHRMMAVAIVALAALAIATPAAAGCMMEFDDCGECARQMLYDAIWDISLEGIEDAWLYGIDCEIDFVHCLLFAHHHEYDCSG